MLPVKFEGSSNINRPKNMTDEQCMSIWAKKGFIDLVDAMEEMEDLGNNIPPPHNINLQDDIACIYFVTAWKPSYEDLQALNRGEPIYIKTLCSTGLPPMAVFTLNEKQEMN